VSEAKAKGLLVGEGVLDPNDDPKSASCKNKLHSMTKRLCASSRAECRELGRRNNDKSVQFDVFVTAP